MALSQIALRSSAELKNPIVGSKEIHAFVHLFIPLFISQTLNTHDIHQETCLSAQNMFFKLFTFSGVINLFHILLKC